MKRVFFTAIALLSLLPLCAQTTFSVLGDSYSTFEGLVKPWWAAVWYSPQSQEKFGNDVVTPEQTWWSKLDATDEFALDTNASWSGSTVCNRGYDGKDYSDQAFISRVHNIGNPDILLIFGGTNDAWAKVPLGDYRYSGWIEEDFFTFRPAFAYLLDQLKSLYPEMKIYNILNSELDDEFNRSVDAICDHYAVPCIHLVDIEKQWGHPSSEGVDAIFSQVYEAIKK